MILDWTLQQHSPLLLNFRRKTSADDSVTQSRSGHPLLCPIQAGAALVQCLWSFSATPKDFIYIFKDSQGLQQDLSSKVALELLCNFIDTINYHYGLKKEDISLHSIQSSSTMAMYLNSIPVYTIMLLGHWSSDAFLCYIHKQVTEFSNNVSHKMIQRPVYHHIAELSCEDPWSDNSMSATANSGMGPNRTATNRNVFSVWAWATSLSPVLQDHQNGALWLHRSCSPCRESAAHASPLIMASGFWYSQIQGWIQRGMTQINTPLKMANTIFVWLLIRISSFHLQSWLTIVRSTQEHCIGIKRVLMQEEGILQSCGSYFSALLHAWIITRPQAKLRPWDGLEEACQARKWAEWILACELVFSEMSGFGRWLSGHQCSSSRGPNCDQSGRSKRIFISELTHIHAIFLMRFLGEVPHTTAQTTLRNIKTGCIRC